MPIEFKKKQAVFVDVASVEEAEPLLAWLQERKSPTVSLSQCTHMHPANLQVLMAAKVQVSNWPEEATFCAWVRSALTGSPITHDPTTPYGEDNIDRR